MTEPRKRNWTTKDNWVDEKEGVAGTMSKKDAKVTGSNVGNDIYSFMVRKVVAGALVVGSVAGGLLAYHTQTLDRAQEQEGAELSRVLEPPTDQEQQKARKIIDQYKKRTEVWVRQNKASHDACLCSTPCTVPVRSGV